MSDQQTIVLDYGHQGYNLKLDYDKADWNIIKPLQVEKLQSAESTLMAAFAKPINTIPIRDIIKPADEVVLVISDNTRPVPNKFLISAIVDYLKLEAEKVTILIGTGSHRPLDYKNLIELLGGEIIEKFKVICHDASDNKNLQYLGDSKKGFPIYVNKHYLKADKKIVLGFIEPHFFAGFSGGAKGICPAICGQETIDGIHAFEIIAHPGSDYGNLETNSQQAVVRDIASHFPPDFLINVTLNTNKEITGIYCGDYIEAHRRGARQVKKEAMIEVSKKYPIVITSNSGYPLDQNLYQTVKGMAASARIVKPGGAIFVASECSRGLPDDGKFADIMRQGKTAGDILEITADPDYHIMDRWQAQKLAMVLQSAKVFLYSSLPADKVESCKINPVNDLGEALYEYINELDYKPSIAVLPHGPRTIPHFQ